LTEEDNGAVIEVLLRRLYHFYGSHTGVLFGIDPSRRSAVEAIVKTIVEDIDSFRELCIENCEYITDSGMFPCKENPFCATCLGADICINSIVTREEVLQLVSNGMAYTAQEIGMALEVRRDTVRGLLSDMELEGLVKRALKGKKVYWWSEK